MADMCEAFMKVRRPPIESPKVSQTLRIDADVLEAFKETGAGWQTRMNEALRQAAKRL